jgi:hypothetical protein
MAPYKLRDMTIKELRATFLAMLTPEWDLALEECTPKEKERAAKVLLAVHSSRIRMGNAELANIRDKLIENEAPLIQGKKELDKALKKLNQVKKVLETAAAFIKIVGRIIKPIAKLT